MWIVYHFLILSVLILTVQAKHRKKDAASNVELSECQQALGMESGDISDSQLSASSEGRWTLNGEPFFMSARNGRLNNNRVPASCWEADKQDESQWFQVNLGQYYIYVTRVATQGCPILSEYTESYKLQYSDDGVNFQYYMERGQNEEKVFSGNTDEDTVVTHDLDPPIMAKYLRFRPVTWGDRIGLRAELYGCKACIDALGMESGAITDEQITASSEWSGNHVPSLARLNKVKTGAQAGSWSAKTNDVNQWLQIELGSEYTQVTRIATQGRSDYDQWVKTYKLKYSHDRVTYQFYREQGQTEDKVFSGNTDRNTVIRHILKPPIIAPYIRFLPITWHNHVSMRVELYGCPDAPKNAAYKWKECAAGLWKSATRLPRPNIPELTWLQTPSIVQTSPGHYKALGRVINAQFLKERLTLKDSNFDVATRNTMALVEQLTILADIFFIEGEVEFYGIRNIKVFAREIVASKGSKFKVKTPDWIQEFEDTQRTQFDGNGKDGVKGNDGEAGPQVEINCEVINGAFDVSSNAGNGHKAQDGGPGADGLNDTPPTADKTTDDCEAVGYDNCHNVDGAKGPKGKRGGDGGNAGLPGKGGRAGRITIRYARSTGTVQLQACGGKGAPPVLNGQGGQGGEGGEGGHGARCKTYYRKPWPVGKSTTGCEKHGDPLPRGPKGDTGDAGIPGSTPSDKGLDGLVEDSSIASGTLNAVIKRRYPEELLLLMRRQAVDLLLGNSNNRQGRSTLEFIKSIVEERDDVEQIKKDVNRKLGFLGQYGYDIFGNNKLFAPLVKWGKLEEDVEEIKNAAKTYENAFNDIISTVTDKENFQEMASKLADVSSKQINGQIARLEEAKSVALKQKDMYVKAIKTQEGRMEAILVKIKNMLPNAQKKVQDKLNRDETIAVLQGMTGFAEAIAGKDPFQFINTALDIASSASNAPCRISLGSSLRSIKKWLTFGETYKPLEDSSDLDFSQVDINSVPEIMQANLEISKEQLAADLVCLLDEHSKPSLTADLEAEIESYFIVGSSRIDMMAKVMDIDNEIGGYNFDIPVLKDTARAVSEVKESPSGSLSNNLQQTFTDNLLSTYRELEQSFMKKLYELYKALGFRTLWVLDDVMRSFSTIASESAYGTGRLNGAVQLTDVFQNMKDIKSKAVTCFSTNPYSTDIQKWSFDKTNNKAMFDELAQGETTFSINIDRSCGTCYNIRLLKIYIELFGTEEQATNVPRKIYIQLRRLGGSYFRSADSETPVKSYRQPLGGFRTVRFDRFTISDEAKCRESKAKCTTYCVTEDDPRWIAMCDNPLNKGKGLRTDSLLGREECKSPFGSYELKIPKDNNMECSADGFVTNTNCKDLDLTKFTNMNVWTSLFYWSGQYPTGPNDHICRSSTKKAKIALKARLLFKGKNKKCY